MDWLRWQARLAELVALHQVPGASLAVLADGEVHRAASGVLNVETGVEATVDSVFQIGSITKVYTATLVMQLVDAGEIDLDEPVADQFDEFRLGDRDALGTVTPRHLLTHSSGIDGDHFVDTGRGDDAVARYVQTCAQLSMTHPVGATCSYCNTGFVVAGRMVERLTGQTWHRALRDRLLEPLGLHQTVTLPEEAIRFRVACGHEASGALVDTWMRYPSMAPAGSSMCASAADVIAFGRVHLDGGAGVLSAASAAAMQEPQIAVPNPWTLGSQWGLGWMLFDWDGRRVLGHDGGTFGQNAFLRMVPDAGMAMALLTNGGHAQDLYQDLFRELLAELCDLHVPQPLSPPDEPAAVDLARYAGVYERAANRVELTEIDGELAARIMLTGPLADLTNDPAIEAVLVPVREDVFVTRLDGARTWTPAVFFTLPDGSRYLHMSGRANPKKA